MSFEFVIRRLKKLKTVRKREFVQILKQLKIHFDSYSTVQETSKTIEWISSTLGIIFGIDENAEKENPELLTAIVENINSVLEEERHSSRL